MMEMFEKTLDTTPIYDGAIIKVQRDTIELPNGEKSFRELVVHNGAVCVVPITEDNMVYMVRQFRYPFKKVLLEVPAGKTDDGETPMQAAHRELEEEIGVKASELIDMGEIYPSVAFLTEVIHMYIARGFTPSKQQLDEDEFLEIVKMPFSEVVDLIIKGEITDGKTIASILKAQKILGI